MIAAGGELNTSSDLVERARTLSSFAEEQDINFTYSVAASGRQAPPAAWSELPYVHMQVSGERERVDVAAWPRQAADVDSPTFSFTDDEAGHRARREAVLHWVQGEEAVITEGTQIRFARPRVIDEMLHGDELMLGAGKLTVAPLPPAEAETPNRVPRRS